MTGCDHRYAATGAERAAAGVTGADLRAAVVADLDIDDPARREYVDIHLRDLDLDLSALIIAAAEGLVGAFLTAVFVFSLGRRVTR